jgi:hypothetical protein
MNTRILMVLTALIVAGGSAAWGADAAKPKEFVHPGMLQNRADLDFMKAKVSGGEQPWKGAWDRLRAQPYSSLDFTPKPAEHVIRGPYGRPSIGSNELIASANAAESHALQWYVTGNKAHAAKVIEIFNAWSPVLHDFQQNDAKLLAGWTGHQILGAAEIIRHTDAGWEQKNIDQFKKMILGVYYPLIKDFYPDANGNWDAAIMDTMLCIGVFCDDREIFNRAVDHYLRGHLNGGITHYVYPSGQCQESTRDQGHTQLGLGEMAQACRVAWTQGVDLFGAADNRLALGFEYTAKYMLGQEMLCEGEISNTGRGRFSDIYYVVYDHYHFERGIEMPFTAMAVERAEARSRSVLTMYRGKRTAVMGKALGPPAPATFALYAGAATQPAAHLPADATVVMPGESIQTAIDAAKQTGGTVVLAKGVHKLPAALRLPTGVTLAGQGVDTIVWLDPQLTGPAIVNAEDATHDITLRDFVIEGAMATKLPTDPNTVRRTRSRPGALARSGIILAVRGAKPLRNIRIDHITVRNCTERGLEIRTANTVAIESSSFTDNGNGSSELEANVLLSKVSGCQIAHSRLNNSPAGCGLRIAGCADVTVISNEIARSAREGVHATDSHDIRIRGCLIEGNEADGLLLDSFRDRPDGLEVTGNVIQNNGGAAIGTPKGIEAVARANRSVDIGVEDIRGTVRR